MSRWDREREDHVFENTVSRPGPIIRSRVVDSEEEPQGLGSERDAGGLVLCPTCGQLFPDFAVACPDDGTSLVVEESQRPLAGE